MKRRLFLRYYKLLNWLIFKKITLEDIKDDLFYLDRLRLEVYRKLDQKMENPLTGKLIQWGELEQLCHPTEPGAAEWVKECHAGLLAVLKTAETDGRVVWKLDTQWLLDDLIELLNANNAAAFPDRFRDYSEFNRVYLSRAVICQLMDEAEMIWLTQTEVNRLCDWFGSDLEIIDR